MKKRKKDLISSLEESLESLNEKMPALPVNAKEAIVKALPWIIVIISIIMLPAVLAIFGVGAFFAPMAFLGGVHFGVMFYISWILSLVVFVMQLYAVKGLLVQKYAAWKILFCATLVIALMNLLTLSIGSLIVFAAISFYILFQIREYYK